MRHRGDTGEANKLLREAAQTATELGMAPLETEINALMPSIRGTVEGRARLQEDGEGWDVVSLVDESPDCNTARV